MSKTLFLKPADPDLIVRDPDKRRALPVDGAEVPNTTYWQRRLKDGDVIKTSRPKPVSKKKD